MKVYEVVFDESHDKGVYALSCVENPAMEDMWLALADHPKEIQFSAVNEEKRLLLGAALIPNKKVYRNIEGEEFYITFSDKTIEQAAHAFIKNGYVKNSSENHDIKLEGVSVVQSWIVDDPKRDKSNVYGKEYEKGTWVTMMKVENDDAWAKAKNGELNGFSIDGLFSLKEINLKSQIDMSEVKKTLLQELREAIGLKKADIKMGHLKLKDGKTKVEFEGDAPELGMPVFLVLEDGERERVPEGEHELEGGEILYVDKNGLVTEAKEEEAAPEPVEEDAVMAELMAVIKEMDAKLSKQINDIEARYEAQLSEAKAKNVELEAKLEKEPAEEKIVKTELSDFQPKTTQDRIWYALQKNKN
jgi:hypothetical protein